MSKQGKKQLHTAETEKYAHVTFFFNGGREQPYEGEDRILVASPKVATYDLKPEMSAFEVKDKLVAAINEAFKQVDAAQESSLGKFAGGMGMGGLGGGLF